MTTLDGLQDAIDATEAFVEILNGLGIPFRVTFRVEGLQKRGANSWNNDPEELIPTGDCKLELIRTFTTDVA